MNVKVHILKLRVQRRPFAHLHILTFAHLQDFSHLISI